MEYVDIDPEVLSNQVGEIDSIAAQVGQIFSRGNQSTLSAAYSDVSGLDQMGASHGLVMQGGVGSAVQTLQKYAEQVAWLRDGLRATERSLTSQEGLSSHALQIADEGGAVGAELTLFPARPDHSFDDFDFPTPSVSIPSSLAELSAAFATTDGGAVAASAQSWDSMAKNAAMLAESIRTTAWDIAEINKADSINMAVDKALEVADAADVFAHNAGLMSTSVTYMGQVADAGAFHVSMAELAIAFIEDPAEREKAEREFLESFMGHEFPAAVESAMPVIRNLMSPEMSGSAGGELQASMGLVDGNGKPGPVARLNAGSQAFESMLANPAQIGPGSFAEVAKGMNGLGGIGAGAGTPFGSLGTQAQSVALPSFGGISPVGTMSPASLGGVGAGASTSPALGSFAPVGLGQSGVGRAPGVGAISPVGGLRASGARSAGAGSQVGGFTRPDLGGAPTSIAGLTTTQSGVAGTGGSTGGFGVGGAGVGMVGAGARPSATSKSRSVLAPGFSTGTATAGGAVSTASSLQPTTRGFMPMGGMPFAGQQQDNKRGKVKTVTSQVEEEGNMSALLGDLPPVVPGPIGAWVRD